MQASGAIDESIAAVQSDASETELREYRRGAGRVLDAIMEVADPDQQEP